MFAATATLSSARPRARAGVRVSRPVRSIPKTRPGSKAENDFVEQYLPLVKTVVNRMAMSLPPHVDAEDLYSSGLVGLLNAVRNFNPRCGSSFASYARLRIRGAILDELRRLDWVPRSVHTKARRVQSVMNTLEQKLGRPPGEEQVARALNLSPGEYQALLDEIRPVTFVCLDSLTWSDETNDDTRHESIPDDSQVDPLDAAARRDVARIVVRRLQQLPDMQRKVLALYYFEDLRLREIAEVMGVTESRICQVHAQAILSLRAALQAPGAPRLEF